MIPIPDHFDADRRWAVLLDAGLYPNRNPPTPPAVTAQLDANDALFRGFDADRRRLAEQGRP